MVAQVLLLSHPRTACHLLERMLSKQPNVKYFSHPFVPARPAQVQSLNDPLTTEVAPELKSELLKAWNQGYSDWENAMDEAKSSVCLIYWVSSNSTQLNGSGRTKRSSPTRIRTLRLPRTLPFDTLLENIEAPSTKRGPYARAKRLRTSLCSLMNSLFTLRRYRSSPFAILA